MNKLKAFGIYRHNSGCDYHRVRLPFIYSKEYIDTDWTENFYNEDKIDFLSSAEVLLYNRDIGLDKDVKDKIHKNTKFVIDIDDYWELNEHNPMFVHYKNGIKQTIINNIIEADAVITTTDILADKIYPLNKNVTIIPNAIPFGYDQFVPSSKKLNQFIYTGQISHLDDVKLLRRPFDMLKYSGINVGLAGFTDNIVSYEMEKIFSKIPNYRRIYNLDLDNYMKSYEYAKCSLIPLQANEFNDNKSNLKLLEAASMKIPAIVSNTSPYNNCNAPALFCNTDKDWVDHIKSMQDDELRILLGNNLYRWAYENYNLLDWNKKRFELLYQVVN